MHRRTGKLRFTQKERKKIVERDGGACIFCRLGYRMEGGDSFSLSVKDIMHFVPRSAGGLGVERNGAVGCRYHHTMLDNGSGGNRKEMLSLFEAYLRGKYPDWDRGRLVYRKCDFY